MFSENAKIVPILVDANFGGGSDCDAINMGEYSKATIVYLNGAHAASVYSFESGADATTKTTSVPFKYAMGGAVILTAVAGSAASADVLGAWTATLTDSASLTCTEKMVVCEVSASAMTAGEPWLTGVVTGASGIVHAIAILEPRYSKNQSVTALA
jgi:hypothetical protein